MDSLRGGERGPKMGCTAPGQDGRGPTDYWPEYNTSVGFDRPVAGRPRTSLLTQSSKVLCRHCAGFAMIRRPGLKPYWIKVQELREGLGWSAWFILTILLESIIDITAQAYLLYRFETGALLPLNAGANPIEMASQSKTLPTYLALFSLAHVFQLFMAYVAVRQKNTIHLLATFIFNGLFLVYSLIELSEVQNLLVLTSHVFAALLVTPIAVGLAQWGLAYFGWKLWKEFGWDFYKRIGTADLQIAKMFLEYHIFICILSYAFFFFVGYTVQSLALVLSKTDAEFVITIVAIPLTLFSIFLVYHAIERELKWPFRVFQGGLLFGIGYCLFKIVRIYQPSQREKYLFTTKSLTTFASITLLLLIASLISSYRVGRNFNKGLKEHMLHMSSSTSIIPTRAISMRLTRGKSSPSIVDARPVRVPGSDLAIEHPYSYNGYGMEKPLAEQQSWNPLPSEHYDVKSSYDYPGDQEDEDLGIDLPELKRGQTMKRYQEAFDDRRIPMTPRTISSTTVPQGTRDRRISID